MRVCSFDVGFRHLAWCLFEVTDEWRSGIKAPSTIPPVQVIKWHLVDLLDGQKATGPVTECVDALADHLLAPNSPLRETIALCNSDLYYMEQQVGQGNQKMYAFSAALRAAIYLVHSQIHGSDHTPTIKAVTPARKALQGLERAFDEWPPVRDHPLGYSRPPPKTCTSYTRAYYKAKSIAAAEAMAAPTGMSLAQEDNVSVDKRDDLADALMVGVAHLVRVETATGAAGRRHKSVITRALGRASAFVGASAIMSCVG